MRRVAIVSTEYSVRRPMPWTKTKDASKSNPPASYKRTRRHEKITIAAIPYNTKELVETAFGKVKPYEHGILPVLVVIQNDTGKALRLDLKAQFIFTDGEHVEPCRPTTSSASRESRNAPACRRPTPLRSPCRAATKRVR